jgi:hypothetical protein
MRDVLALPEALFAKEFLRHCRSEICFEIVFPVRGLEPPRLGYNHAIKALGSEAKLAVNGGCCDLSRRKRYWAYVDR